VSLEIEATTSDGIAFVRFVGELDLTAAEQAEHALAEVEVNEVVLDLRDLTFIDSTGLRIVLSAEARARERDGRVVIVRGPEPVDRVFRLAQLDERLHLVDTLDEAGVEEQWGRR
jgi:anti-sigma B factor antagonist